MRKLVERLQDVYAISKNEIDYCEGAEKEIDGQDTATLLLSERREKFVDHFWRVSCAEADAQQ
jgi:hypothetical protein